MTVSNVFVFMSRLEGTRLTVCVTCVWAGVDSAWEQKKLEARKMLENAAESHTSGARFVRRVLPLPVLLFLNPFQLFPLAVFLDHDERYTNLALSFQLIQEVRMLQQVQHQ